MDLDGWDPRPTRIGGPRLPADFPTIDELRIEAAQVLMVTSSMEPRMTAAAWLVPPAGDLTDEEWSGPLGDEVRQAVRNGAVSAFRATYGPSSPYHGILLQGPTAKLEAVRDQLRDSEAGWRSVGVALNIAADQEVAPSTAVVTPATEGSLVPGQSLAAARGRLRTLALVRPIAEVSERFTFTSEVPTGVVFQAVQAIPPSRGEPVFVSFSWPQPNELLVKGPAYAVVQIADALHYALSSEAK